MHIEVVHTYGCFPAPMPSYRIAVIGWWQRDVRGASTVLVSMASVSWMVNFRHRKRVHTVDQAKERTRETRRARSLRRRRENGKGNKCSRGVSAQPRSSVSHLALSELFFLVSPSPVCTQCCADCGVGRVSPLKKHMDRYFVFRHNPLKSTVVYVFSRPVRVSPVERPLGYTPARSRSSLHVRLHINRSNTEYTPYVLRPELRPKSSLSRQMTRRDTRARSSIMCIMAQG